ncbi:MAG: class I SAM-dependent methyltransferase, partial [bacterium]|nr:class I SAM-dependent methyltransferase [bacterium]
MKQIRQIVAKGVATQLVRLTLSRPAMIERSGFVRVMERIFSPMAPSYDRVWARMGSSSQILAPLDSALQDLSTPPQRILDLGCGTGLATFEAKERFPRAFVVGADLSESMVQTLMTKRACDDSAAVIGLVAHSGMLPFRDRAFDLVMTQNAPPYLEEMVRVLHPEGSLILAYSFVYLNALRRPMEKRLRELPLDRISII